MNTEKFKNLLLIAGLGSMLDSDEMATVRAHFDCDAMAQEMNAEADEFARAIEETGLTEVDFVVSLLKEMFPQHVRQTAQETA